MAKNGKKALAEMPNTPKAVEAPTPTLLIRGAANGKTEKVPIAKQNIATPSAALSILRKFLTEGI